MDITKDIVLELEKKLKCPILEMFYDGEEWYVCFEQDIVVDGVGQIVSLDEVMDEVKKYDNVENFTNEVYADDFKDDTWVEQVTFTWK